jgi:peroxiredoxin Q/BCP
VQLEADRPQFEQKNAQILAVAVQDQAGAQQAAAETGAAYPILADPDHRMTEAYGVFNTQGDNVATPAVFIIDKNGQIAWSYIGQGVSDRPSNQTILDNVPND